ncbi:MAG: glycosyltransferase family 2 protein [Lachnospiraceae bacterium]|nr:glycosyltransferase family 2 protein [Lachnospiraceae bacterium]
MENVKLSVLITTYNIEKYVDETLKSVLAQKTDEKFEVLVGDDGSSDGTVGVVKKWQEKYPDIISLYVMDRDNNVKYNRIERASKNRINLIKHAKGEYFIFLDGDDFYNDDTKYDKQIKLLDSKEYQDCVACGHNSWIYWNEDKKELINRCEKKIVVKSSDYWKYGMYLLSNSIMFRNIYRDGSSEKIPVSYFDDNMITFCALSKGDILYIPDVMACYRQLDNSSWNSVDDIEKNIINLIDLDIELRVDKSFRKESIYRHLYSMYYIWRHPDEVTDEVYNKFAAQIERDRLSWTKHWLLYKKYGKLRKMKMSAWMCATLFRYIFVKIGRKIFKKYL